MKKYATLKKRVDLKVYEEYLQMFMSLKPNNLTTSEFLGLLLTKFKMEVDETRKKINAGSVITSPGEQGFIQINGNKLPYAEKLEIDRHVLAVLMGETGPARAGRRKKKKSEEDE